MLAAVPIITVASGGSAGVGADPLVIARVSDFGDQLVQVVMAGAFAALVIQQEPDVLGLPAVDDGGREHAVRQREFGEQVPAAPLQREFAALEQCFPGHDHSVRQ